MVWCYFACMCAQEWRYVNGLAQARAGCTPGTRDEYNEGKSVEDFQKIANDYYIRQRRDLEIGIKLPEGHAFLTQA